MFPTTKLSFFALVLLAFIFTSSCRKFEEFSPEPEIGFYDFKFFLTPQGNFEGDARLYISYRDGDGDIGLDQSDTIAPFGPDQEFYYNLVIRYFEKQNGLMVERTEVNFSARIPPLIPKNQKRSIEGIIEYDLKLLGSNPRYDTIQFKIKMADRALHWSNEVSTPLIIKPGP